MHQGRAQAVARSLGWFSIALGVAELVAPRAIARAAGLQGRERLLQAYGLREIATGVGILFARNRRPWVAARIAGDALDIATLAAGRNPRAAAALAAVGGVTALDAYAVAALRSRKPHRVVDYSMRSGFRKPPAEMRGAAAYRAKSMRRTAQPQSQPEPGIYAPS